jgi:hypothetical protein
MTRPRLVTVIERDPVMVRIALDWFGVDRLGPLELVCADAVAAAQGLTRLGRRFDFVMEDAACFSASWMRANSPSPISLPACCLTCSACWARNCAVHGTTPG